MRPRRDGSILRLIAVTLLSAMLLLPSPSASAAKPVAKGAKPAAKAAKSAVKPAVDKSKTESGSSSSSSSTKSGASSPTAYEVPSPGQPETPPKPPSDTSAKPADTSAKPADTSAKPADTPTKPAESPSAEAPKEPTPEAPPSESSLPQETTIPPIVDSTPPAEPAPIYVEHLGPSSYPGKLRGLYGGSLWLEPSFHGLQWPYMAKSGVGVSGWFWVDNGYEQIRRERMGNTTLWLQQGRAALRVTPTYTNGSFFIQAQVELVGNVCQVSGTTCATEGTFDTDDLWIRFGQWNVWDLKVGRFEAWELYHTGMGLDINTLERRGASNFGLTGPAGVDAPDFYGMNWMHDRPQAGLGVGYLAFHAYPSNNFRFELLGELGVDNPKSGGSTYLGGRPALIFDQGWMKAKIGAEYERGMGDTSSFDSSANKQVDSKLKRTRWGVGGTLQFVIDPRAEFGGNIAHGSQNWVIADPPGTSDPFQTFTRTSVGGFANVRLGALWLLGLGANFTWQNDSNYTSGSISPDYTAHLQAFGAVQYLLARQLYIKAVIGYARADFVASDESIDLYSSYMYSGRVRLMYLY